MAETAGDAAAAQGQGREHGEAKVPVQEATLKDAGEFGDSDREVAMVASSLNSMQVEGGGDAASPGVGQGEAQSSAQDAKKAARSDGGQKDESDDGDESEDEDDGGFGFFNPDLFTSNVEYELSEFRFSRKPEDGCTVDAKEAEEDLIIKLSYLHASNQLIEKFVSRVVWPSAEEMARYFTANPSLVRGKRILELGSGTGLCGITMARLGAASVVLTDYNEASVELLQENIDLNSAGDVCSTARLVWGDDAACAEILEGMGLEHFDLVVGTDVVYEPECIQPLLQSARAFLNGSKSSRFFLANHTHRYGTYAELVHTTAASLGFSESVQTPITCEEGQIDFSIFSLLGAGAADAAASS
ncbi:Protein N-lysine methyltransferase METTL21A [Hondaea fermentalgiana]|uniref:Protein N-lysine methyltransferase METTL21A n=1 Tax=Hondaea fermentalgiana TaxID=2315210 RepID=A0A2R5GEE3_9STRA|nr:Protein N-lysine methyltransferase METTL21A [Hondaea fermentalgiana]|eukprot:GBG26194.1 Protein N-lysine methyltransferase METTL21A [Hondaea fermentalgiana]